MKIDRRVTNGLAWAGVLLVVGVPTADLLSAQFLGDPAPAQAQVAMIERVAPVPAPLSQRPVAKPVAEVAVAAPAVTVPVPPVEQVAAVVPAKPAPAAPPASSAAQTADVVDAWLKSGKPLPSYLTDASSTPVQVAVTPPARTPITTAPVETDPIQVASIPQPKVAPMPMPLSMRPRPVAVAAAPGAVVVSTDLVVAPPGAGPRPPANVTADDLEAWESGPLSEFLARRQAMQQAQEQPDPSFDEDGFFLDEGPNRQRPPRDVLIGPANDFFFPFVN